MYRRILPLIGILAISWILIFAGSYIIFELIVPLPDFFPGRMGALLTAAIKVLLAAILVGAWLMIMVMLRNLYMEKKLFT